MRRALLGLRIPALAAGVWLAVSACGAAQHHAPPGSTGGRASTAVPTVPQAHPQAVEPKAGVAAPRFGPSAGSTPVGDPTAHARTLAQVKRELKILNLCGGATSPAFAEPVVQGKGPGFVADPGTIQNVGELPILTARLDALAKSLGVTIYGISGYRTPAHSVAVGGFADDPHTKGLAEDIGVNSCYGSARRRSARPSSPGSACTGRLTPRAIPETRRSTTSSSSQPVGSSRSARRPG